MSDEMKELAQMLHNTCVDETGVSEGMSANIKATQRYFHYYRTN